MSNPAYELLLNQLVEVQDRLRDREEDGRPETSEPTKRLLAQEKELQKKMTEALKQA